MRKDRGSRIGLWIAAGLVLAGAWWILRGGEAGEETAGAAAEALEVARVGVSPEFALQGPGVRSLERAAISGAVRDPQGRAIAGAQVCAVAGSRLLDPQETRKPRCATTGRDGRYRLENLWGVRHNVSAGAPGFVPAFHRRPGSAKRLDPVELRPGAEAREVDITLEGGAIELRGTVKDLSGGAIEGALVRSGGLFYGTGMAYATSGPEGEFSLWVKPGRPQVWAEAEGYAGGSDSGPAPGHVFEIFMTPEAVLVGKVVRAGDGSPVAGARVRADRGDSWGGSGSAMTDEGGNFRLDRLSPGAYKPRAEADDAYGVAAEQVILGLGETSETIVIQAHPAFVVGGRVVVTGGASCEDGSVHLKDASQGRESGGEVEADGLVHIAGVLDGNYEVSVRCRGFVSAEKYEAIEVKGASVTGSRWEVTRGQSIRGVVVSAKGEPVEGVNLAARAKVDPAKPRARKTDAYGVETDAQGRFEIAGLLAGAYDLQVYSVNNARALPGKPIEVTLPEGQDVEGLRIECPAIGEVRGVVREPQGKGVARAQVSLRANGLRSLWATTADDGSFHVPEIEAGEYRVSAARDGFQLRAPGTGDDDVQGVPVEVRAGAVGMVELVVEAAAGTITGVVRDEGGGPVGDAFIEATRESESAASAGGAGAMTRWFSGGGRPLLTDADGRFRVDSLFPGKYTVRAARRGGGEAIAEHVALGSDVALTIAATGRLAGTVALPGGAALAEFTATVEDAKTGYRRTDTFFRTNGAWSFAELPAGSYKLQISASEGAQSTEVSLGSGEEKTGLRVELAAKVTLRGTVVDLEGAPVPGIEVMVSDSGMFRFGPDTGGEKKHVTDAAGRFEVARASTGLVQVRAWPLRPDEYEAAFFSARIEGGGSVVELPPIRVARQQVKPGEAAGDLGLRFKQDPPGADPLQRKLVVAVVRPGSPAAAAGVQVGDEVVHVGGQDVTGTNSYLYGALTRVPVGGVVRLGLARGVTVDVAAAAPP